MNPHHSTLCNLRLGRLCHILSSEIYSAVTICIIYFLHLILLQCDLFYGMLDPCTNEYSLYFLLELLLYFFARLLKCPFLMRPGYKVIYVNGGLMVFSDVSPFCQTRRLTFRPHPVDLIPSAWSVSLHRCYRLRSLMIKSCMKMSNRLNVNCIYCVMWQQSHLQSTITVMRCQQFFY